MPSVLLDDKKFRYEYAAELFIIINKMKRWVVLFCVDLFLQHFGHPDHAGQSAITRDELTLGNIVF